MMAGDRSFTVLPSLPRVHPSSCSLSATLRRVVSLRSSLSDGAEWAVRPAGPAPVDSDAWRSYAGPEPQDLAAFGQLEGRRPKG